MSRFVQTAPPLPDPYASDHVLRSYLDRYLGPARVAAAAPRLTALAADVTAQPPRRAHGRRNASSGAALASTPGAPASTASNPRPAGRPNAAPPPTHAVVALPYLTEARERFGSAARTVQQALLHVYGPESATFSCPVAMSDGAAALLSRPDVPADLRDAWLPRLISTDPGTAITSGQWMTESQGGSDISRSTTTARSDGDTWRVSGEKWFCSAADAAMAVALARPDGAAPGSRTLAPFLIPRYATDGHAPASGITLHRLKDKLGTRAVPTAEIGLDAAVGYPVGDPLTGGLTRMMTLVVVTRLHNAAAASGGMRRGLDYARAYASVRSIAGGRLDANPLHRATLTRLAVDAEAAFALTAHAFALLGAVEVDGDTGAADELRLIAPLAKIATGRWAVASASEYLECFGGAGFVEETGIPRLLRDAQVLPIWEGTTNVLSVDVLRAVARDEGVKPLLARVDAALDLASPAGVGNVDTLATARDRLAAALASAAANPTGPLVAAGARDLAMLAADVVTSALLVEQAAYESARGDRHAATMAELWIASRLARADIGATAAGLFDLVVDRR